MSPYPISIIAVTRPARHQRLVDSSITSVSPHCHIPNGDYSSQQELWRKRMRLKMIGSLICALALAGATFAQAQYGTAAEAKAMLEKAVAAVKADKAKALDMFNKGEGGFLDRDLYPFASIAAMARSSPSAIPMPSRSLARISGRSRTPPASRSARSNSPPRRSRRVSSPRSAICFPSPAPTRRRLPR